MPDTPLKARPRPIWATDAEARGAGVPPAKAPAEISAPPSRQATETVALSRGSDDGLLRQMVDELRGQVRQQQDEINELTAAVKRIDDELHDLRRALGG